MASLRRIKKDIDFLVSEVISDCYACLYFNKNVEKEKVYSIIENTVNLRNQWIESANHPAEKNNARLVRKHYQQLHLQMMEGIDAQFNALSDLCKA